MFMMGISSRLAQRVVRGLISSHKADVSSGNKKQVNVDFMTIDL